MTGEDSSVIAAHRETVHEGARASGPLSPASEREKVNNRDWFVRGPDGVDRPRGERRQLHDSLVAAYREEFPDVRAERKAIILAGPPGAGKSTVLADVLGADRGAWITVDADEFKRALLTEAIKDGSYDCAIIPPEVRAAEAAGSGSSGSSWHPSCTRSLPSSRFASATKRCGTG